MSLVERIQKLCSSKNTTLVGLEREIGLGRGTIRNWDKNSPSIDKLQKVAKYFEVSIDELLLGFNPKLFAAQIKMLMNKRDINQYLKDTGIDEDEFFYSCLENAFQQPSIDTVKKIIDDNPLHPVISRSDIIKAAGYDLSDIQSNIINQWAGAGKLEFTTALPSLTAKDEREIAKDLESMLNSLDVENGMAAYNDPEDEEDRELLKASLLTSMRLAKQIAKKKFTPKKYRKE